VGADARSLQSHVRMMQFVTPKKGSSLLGQRGVKVGGFRVPMQDVSGVAGSARNEAMTVWVHGD